MSAVFDCSDDGQRAEGLALAHQAVTDSLCIVLPTDTVYGVGADAFSPRAVATLLASKGRGRNMPPPVLIARLETMDGLATEISDAARALADAFWPGPLTLILHAQPSLTWDLGETKGTVALRMPKDELALDLLTMTGPLAVSSANRSGQPAANDVVAAQEQLGESIEVYLDGGARTGSEPSTIVDMTSGTPVVVRVGALSVADLQAVVPEVTDTAPEPETTPEQEQPEPESEQEPPAEPPSS